MSNLKSLKTWKQVANPSIAALVFMLIFSFLASACSLVGAIPAAKAITAISVLDFALAVKNLCIVFALEAVRAIFLHILCRLDIFQLTHVYTYLQEKLFSKIYAAEDANFKYTSKEKMVNIISNNLVTLGEFSYNLATRFAYLLEAITTIAIIFSINYLMGFAMLLATIVSYLLINTLNRAIGKKTLFIQSEKDSLAETFADMVDGRRLSTDLNLQSNIHSKYFGKVAYLLGGYKRQKLLGSLRDNWLNLVNVLVVLLASIYLVRLVEIETITATLYLVLTPYLTTSLTKFVSFFSLSKELQDASVAAMRVRTLLNMSEKELGFIGNNTTDSVDGTLAFSMVEYNAASKLDPSVGSIKNCSFTISKNTLSIFEGVRGCGKRAIFYMLTRAIKPDQGTITLGAINIYDFDTKTYKHNLSYTTSKPYFFNDSILNNLLFVCPNKKAVFEAVKKVNLADKILSLPEGYNTNLVKNPSALSPFEKYLLSLARSLLTKSEVLLIYELPVGLTDAEIKTLKEILLSLKKEKTIILFTALCPFDGFNNHFMVSNSAIKKVNN